jgi:hypothetical protein
VAIFLAVSLCKPTYITAHEAAYKSGILHQDISVGNILIVGDNELGDFDFDGDDRPKPKIEGGMLIDWDLSKIVDPNDGCSNASYTVS